MAMRTASLTLVLCIVVFVMLCLMTLAECGQSDGSFGDADTEKDFEKAVASFVQAFEDKKW